MNGSLLSEIGKIGALLPQLKDPDPYHFKCIQIRHYDMDDPTGT